MLKEMMKQKCFNYFQMKRTIKLRQINVSGTNHAPVISVLHHGAGGEGGGGCKTLRSNLPPPPTWVR